jgi:hypothetical protein
MVNKKMKESRSELAKAKCAWCREPIPDGVRPETHPMIPHLYFCCHEHMTLELEWQYGEWRGD